ncbi:MAG TPA: MFS transporter [Anaerolineales bacterium]|nr:MFS transporter [Anaerolineales bacterium]
MRSRNVFLLALGQALGMAGPGTVVLLGGIIGADLAPNPSLATLPASLGIVSMALMSIPGALLMRAIGRKRGFILGNLIAASGALLAAFAITQQSFVLFCVAIILVGQNGAFILQYRFAAAESVESAYAGRAISLVLVGGILAGYLGPEIAQRAQSWLPTQYTGSFVALAILYGFAILIITLMRDIRAPKLDGEPKGRQLSALARQPTFQVAVLAGVVSYGLMNFVMTATPIHMHSTGFGLQETAWVIQSHIVAMYLPSLVSGFLVERLGTLRIMLAGTLLMLGTNVVAMLGIDLNNYWVALVLLGLGWNLLFVGGTVLLTTTYRPEERFKSQAANDFTIFTMQAVSSFSAGAVLSSAGWAIINWFALSVLLVAGIIFLMQRRQIACARSLA